MQTIFFIIISLSIALIIFGIFVLVVNHFYKSDTYVWAISDHFDGKHFYNIGWSPKKSMRLELGWEKKWWLLYWLLHREKAKWKKRSITPVIPESHVTSGITVTNIGHATYLIQVDGVNILTDPVWWERASPWWWIWPKRYQDPGVRYEDLPKIDVVLLSHNHYDHMEIPTLAKLEKRDNPVIYTWLGNKEYLAKRGVKNVVEMDWFQVIHNWKFIVENAGAVARAPSDSELSIIHYPLSITFLPAQHFSARGITDRNRTLWWTFAVEIWGKSIYFGGDTGYGREFIEKTRERFSGGFDIGLIPIGAYKPRWFMAPVHTDPFEWMQMQRDLSIDKAIGIHHSTFDLADDNQDDPLDDLETAKKRPEYRGQIFEVGRAGTVWKW
jgi:L-ascorbate metabolism protein UlaG (beta-lactamase superfamily)